MLKHIVIWNLAEDIPADKRAEVAAKIKSGLEGLNDSISFVKDLTVNTDLLPGSDADIILECCFESEKEFSEYQRHPAHVAIGTYIRSVTTNRHAVDYTK